MKGFIYNGPHDIEMRELPLPPCGEKDIIIKNIYAGICGSDITAYKQDGTSIRIYPGFEFGHELVGEVVEIGSQVEGLKKGDRVYPYPMTCKDDRTRSATVGGFSEYIHIPNCRLDYSVYKVDDRISSRVAAMIEPFTVGGQAAILSAPREGQNAIVFGAGIIGMAAAITLKHLGCDRVMLVNRSTYRLDIAAKLGFYTCSPVEQDLNEAARAALGTAYGVMGETVNADIYVDATGADDAFDFFQKHGKLNAVFTMVGLHHKPMTLNPLPLTYASQRIQGSGGYTPDAVRLAMEIMSSGKYDLEQLITHEYPHEKLEEAIQKASISRESMKVLIRYE